MKSICWKCWVVTPQEPQKRAPQRSLWLCQSGIVLPLWCQERFHGAQSDAHPLGADQKLAEGMFFSILFLYFTKPHTNKPRQVDVAVCMLLLGPGRWWTSFRQHLSHFVIVGKICSVEYIFTTLYFCQVHTWVCFVCLFCIFWQFSRFKRLFRCTHGRQFIAK